MGKIDLVCGLVTGAVSILFYIGTLSFPEMSIGIDPRAYPMVVILSSFALSILLIVQGLRKARARPGPTPAPQRGKTLPRGRTAWYLVILAAGMLAYALTMEDLGYIIATPFLTGLTMYLFGERKAAKIVIVSILVSVVLYWIFRSIFRVPLPRSFF